MRKTSIIARSGNRIGGYISAYIIPEQRETLFVWQVAVHPDFRQRGLGVRMLSQILNRPICKDLTHIETTVSPSNLSSRKLFYRIAESLGTGVSEEVLFERELFGNGEDHEEECLLRIGPFYLGI